MPSHTVDAISNIHQIPTALGDVAPRTLSNATKTVPMMEAITPCWLVHLLPWTPVEAGIYRVNKVKSGAGIAVDCSSLDEKALPQTFVDYEEWGREPNPKQPSTGYRQ